jgi:hypothetical protein
MAKFSYTYRVTFSKLQLSIADIIDDFVFLFFVG